MSVLRSFFLALILLIAAPVQAAGDADWFYRGSDIPRDPAWRFGTLPNGVKYAVRQNELPEDQVSIRVRIDAGALNEEDHERGWAHLVEHLAFRGSKSFGDREGRRIWQTLGASFGSDTNASTSPTQTVYQLDLPHADAANLDKSLHVLSEMVDTALFDPAAVAAEKKIVLQEKARRPELSVRMMEASMPLFYGGLKFAERDTIGTDETLNGATAEGLRAFYERWYRPDRTVVIMVGDADPAMMESLIAKRFADWRASGPPPREPDYGAIARNTERTGMLAYPGAPYAATVMWLRPYEAMPHTLVREKEDFSRALASRILNRRLEARARAGTAPYVNAGVSAGRLPNVADSSQLSVVAREGQWREALQLGFGIISDAVAAPPSEAEIDRELQNIRTAALSALEGERTALSQQRAQQLVRAIDGGSVVTDARNSLDIIDRLSPQMKPQLIGAAMRRLFQGEGPRLMLLSPEPVEGGLLAVGAAFAAAEKAPPAERQADRKVSMDSLPPLGRPGQVVSRRHIPDLDVTIVRFANGATLTFKRTAFERGSVSVQLRFGNGFVGLPADRDNPTWLSGIIGPSGLADLDLDGMERLMTGRRMSLSFGLTEDAFELRGSTTAADLQDQLRLLATKIAYPRYDAPLLERYKAGALDSYDLSFASATARAAREFPFISRGGDPRWSPAEKAEIRQADLGRFKAFFDPLLARGPVEAIIVGDVTLDVAVEAMRKTIGALPKRSAASVPEALRQVQPPAPNPRPQVFTHEGAADQAYALIGWSTFGGTSRILERRALSVAANIIEVRLFERLREEEGATYSPDVAASSSEELPAWGIFYAAAEIKPESADTFFRIAREVVADMAAKPAAPDEFARAKNPVVTGIERRLMTNGYWLSAMENWTTEPELIEQTRNFLADYKNMTAEDVRRAVAAHVADAGDWSMLVLPSKAKAGGN
jgi:zinc protease